MVEFWAPLKDHFEVCEEFPYVGLLSKFFGLDPECQNMLLFSWNAKLLFRGSIGQAFTSILNTSL